ncbi:allophanate hydrolase [Cohnella silvisoli]|uniref:Allophanate hydrolase n=1 Tax=Cohnella silvisoli TaxID=2873699 RepID=A0ABV1KYL7_9BACL|nr:allophanate hydrolase [Cohnella silvisoli]MCD9026519.1 allophanate hydrolase [Cohnella silvisoli]
MSDNLFIPIDLTAAWLKENYAAGKITPKQVVTELIRRAEEDRGMNIWITPPTLELIQPYLDRLAALDPNQTPLWGIPFAIKDNIDLAGVPTTAACPEYAYTPSEHAVVVARLIAAGAIPMGKTNLDQFATGLVGTRSPYGETHNSLKEELISGGSSAGSAVAVARGQAVFSLGTDTAGSGRVPAALNKLVGYKPSLGAWSTKGVVPACASLDCVTVFARNTEEALTVDRAVRGIELTDPWSRLIVMPKPHLPAKLVLPLGELEFYGPYAELYRASWQQAVEHCKSLNIPIEYVDLDLFAKAAAILYEGPWVAERWAALGDFIEAHPGVAFPVTEAILRNGAGDKYQAATVFRAIHELQAYKMETRRMLKDAVLVLPTCGGTWSREQVRQDPIGTNRDMGKYTNHCNLLDLCAIAIPGEDAAPGLPFGITLFALSDQEDLIVGAANLFAHGSVIPQQPAQASEPKTTLIAVCGLHMRGFPLEKQMIACGAKFVRETMSAAKYQFVKLPTTPAKPGMIKQSAGGAAIQLEVWEMPLESFGSFTAAIPAPLGIGKVEIEDGTEIPGFTCEAYAAEYSEDITHVGGWRNLMQQT